MDEMQTPDHADAGSVRRGVCGEQAEPPARLAGRHRPDTFNDFELAQTSRRG